MTAPKIGTTPTCPPHLPCPTWCNRMHSGEYVSEHGPHAWRMHFACTDTVKLPSGRADVSISAADTWHAGGEWERAAAEVAVHINTMKALAIGPNDHQALTVVGALNWDLYKAIQAAHKLVKDGAL